MLPDNSDLDQLRLGSTQTWIARFYVVADHPNCEGCTLSHTAELRVAQATVTGESLPSIRLWNARASQMHWLV